MNTHALDTRLSAPRILTRCAWVPLCAVLALIIVSVVSGQSGIRSAHATDVFVEGSVSTGIFLDSSECLPAAGTIGDVFLGTDAWRTAQDSTSQVCKLTFGSPGHPAGAELVLLDDPGVAGFAGPALRCTVGACNGQSIADYNNAAEPSANTSAFGTQLLNTGAAAAAVWTAAPAVHRLDTADVPCRTASMLDGDCSFTWGVTGAASDIPGSYVAHVQSLVVAR